MEWKGSYQIKDLLNGDWILVDSIPEKNSVYVVSKSKWTEQPSKEAEILYVGSNTGKSARFRTRVGDLIADMFGLSCEETGHSSGGKSLNKYCREEKINPNELFIGWEANCECGRCEESGKYVRRAES